MPLRAVFWETTLRCNAYCEFCGSRCGDVKTNELPGEAVINVFRRIAAAYDPKGIMISVTGGEPLLRHDVFDVMADVSAMGFPWGMTTNGSLITDEVIRGMMRSGMRTVSVSIDGLPETHNRMRGLPDGFQRSMEGLRLLKDASFLNHIQVTTTVGHTNISELDELYEILLPLGPDSWRVALVDPIGRAKDQEAILCDRADLQRYFDFMDRHQYDGRLPVTASCSHYLGWRDAAYRGHPFFCGAGRIVASILANGDISVCPNVERHPKLIQGNVLKDDFVDVWENGFSWYRDDEMRRQGRCRECDSWENCRGDAAHTWDFDGNAPRFCIRAMSDEDPEDRECVTLAPGLLDLIRDTCSEQREKEDPGAEQAFLLYGETEGHRAAVRSIRSTRWDQLDAMLMKKPEEVPEFQDAGAPLIGVIHSHPAGLLGQMDDADRRMREALHRTLSSCVLYGVMVPRFRLLNIYRHSPNAPVAVMADD